MSRLMISSDLHLGHNAIAKYRTKFSSAEEHHEIVFDNLATNINKKDSLILLGDVTFTDEWLDRVASINCAKKTLILGNHETDRKLSIKKVVDTYDSIHSLWSKRNCWFSHCPIHPQEMRGRVANIHGHLHNRLVTLCNQDSHLQGLPDGNYINVCLEHWDYKPVSFSTLQEKFDI